MGVSVPDDFDVDADVDIDYIAPITVSSVGRVGPVAIEGIPDTYNIYVKELPKIVLSIEPITIEPVDISLRLKEIPSVRGHLPANFCIGMSVLGLELAAIRLCGEAQMITEPYRPNPCEYCGRMERQIQELPSLALKES